MSSNQYSAPAIQYDAPAMLVKGVDGDIVTLIDADGHPHDIQIPPELGEKYFNRNDVIYVDVRNPSEPKIVASVDGVRPASLNRIYMLSEPRAVELSPLRKALLETQFEE